MNLLYFANFTQYVVYRGFINDDDDDDELQFFYNCHSFFYCDFIRCISSSFDLSLTE